MKNHAKHSKERENAQNEQKNGKGDRERATNHRLSRRIPSKSLGFRERGCEVAWRSRATPRGGNPICHRVKFVTGSYSSQGGALWGAARVLSEAPAGMHFAHLIGFSKESFGIA